MSLGIVIPAAGASSRMRGADKLLEDVDGRPCLEVMARRALQISDQVCVTLPARDHPRAQVLAPLDVTLVPVPDAALGMSVSLKAGIAALPQDIDAIMILPADMPDLRAYELAQIRAVFDAGASGILQGASAEGRPGHPVIFDAKYREALMAIAGDKGASSVIHANARDRACLPLDGMRACRDLDTPEDWAAWRAARG